MENDTPFINPKLLALQTRHRQLDEEIQRLLLQPAADQLTIQRFKKEKLQLKDQIEKLKDELIPDLNA